MKPHALSLSSLVLLSSGALLSAPSFANDFSDALGGGTTTGDLRLRYEKVDEDKNPGEADDAKALTLRTRLTYETQVQAGFSALLEMEDVRVVGGVDDYTVGPTGFNPGEYSVLADPETTELDQALLQYHDEFMTVKIGRQVITYDGHRFIGHVGWRQDRQTFDALSTSVRPLEGLTVNYSFIGQRNRIFAEAADINAKDHLLNASYDTTVGKFVGYAYLLDDEDSDEQLDTLGFSYNGAFGSDSFKVLTALEYATQEEKTATTDFDADYGLVELGIKTQPVTVKLGYEVLGSDDGGYGFSTPLATLHKFNGWADIFLGTPPQGLVDTYLSVGGKAGPVNWLVAYHDFEADDDTPTISDLGDELDLQVVWAVDKQFSVGLKYAAYDVGDNNTDVDTDKLWVWTSLKF